MWKDKDGNASPGWVILEVPIEKKTKKEDGTIETSIVPTPMRIFNPTNEQYIQAGYTNVTPPPPAPDPTYEQHHQEFLSACAQFRAVCGQIQQAAQLESFTGGFDEMVAFQQSEVYSTLPGIQLAIAWSAANDLCTYLASKLGIGQPEWWYDCWAQVTPEQATLETEPEQEPEQAPIEQDTTELEPAEDITSETQQVEQPEE